MTPRLGLGPERLLERVELVGRPPSAPRVCGPTTPSALSPLRAWKALTAARVWRPKTPSAAMPSWQLERGDGRAARSPS